MNRDFRKEQEAIARSIGPGVGFYFSIGVTCGATLALLAVTLLGLWADLFGGCA